MISLSRGQKIKLADISNALQLQVKLRLDAPALKFDFSCFGLDEAGKLSDDRYFIFFNQIESPETALQLKKFTPHEAHFALDLARLPASVNRLVFVATVDGEGAMNGIQNGQISLSDASGVQADFSFRGSDFGVEKAVMVAEIYLKGEWRVAANGQGFAQGLNAVLKHFGGQEIEETPAPLKIVEPVKALIQKPVLAETATVPAAPKVVSLTKEGTSHKIDLGKRAGEIIATATWIDNGDKRSDNDDLDLRAGILLPDGKMQLVTCDQPGSLKKAPFVSHDGDVKGASRSKPGQESMKVSAQIAQQLGGDVAIVFSVYSAVSNGAVSVASLQPQMKLQFGDQVVNCKIDFKGRGGFMAQFVYTYVIGVAIIRDGQIEILPGGQTSKPMSEATPQLRWNGENGVKITVDGPANFKR